jgi:hypothetical protein
MHLYDEDNDDDAEELWGNQRSDSAAENPDGSDLEYGDDVKCFHCGRYIHDQVDLCPYCKMWQSDEVTRSRKPKWFYIMVVATLFVVIVCWVVLRF